MKQVWLNKSFSMVNIECSMVMSALFWVLNVYVTEVRSPFRIRSSSTFVPSTISHPSGRISVKNPVAFTVGVMVRVTVTVVSLLIASLSACRSMTRASLFVRASNCEIPPRNIEGDYYPADRIEPQV